MPKCKGAGINNHPEAEMNKVGEDRNYEFYECPSCDNVHRVGKNAMPMNNAVLSGSGNFRANSNFFRGRNTSENTPRNYSNQQFNDQSRNTRYASNFYKRNNQYTVYGNYSNSRSRNLTGQRQNPKPSFMPPIQKGSSRITGKIEQIFPHKGYGKVRAGVFWYYFNTTYMVSPFMPFVGQPVTFLPGRNQMGLQAYELIPDCQ